jgi:hypothetical protein
MSKVITIGESVIGTRKFGGLVYAISCEFGGTESPSTLTLSIVREQTPLSEPSLNPASPSYEELAIGGGRSFKGYRVSWNKDVSPDQETMQVKYVDGSFVLDSNLIGLKKKHGRGGGSMIILGKEYHPCDDSENSLQPFSFNPEKREIDWCDPCPFCPSDKYELSCQEPVSLYRGPNGENIDSSKILDVKYTYNEFFQKIQRLTNLEFEKGGEYRDRPVDHTGTIRDVLSSFCSEWGFTWYWDFFENKLKLVDLKSPTNVDDEITSDLENLAEYSISKSIEETFHTVPVITYEKEGGSESYNCSDERIISLTPMTVNHLVNISDKKKLRGIEGSDDENNPGGNDPLRLGGEDGIRLDILAALAYYSQALWECGVYYNGYGILNVEKAEELKGETLDYLGGMKIIEVYPPEQSIEWSSAISEEERVAINEANFQAVKDGTDTYYYTLLVDLSLEGLAKEYERNKNMAQSFLGQYWFRRYSPTFCGGTAKSSNVSIEAPDGSGTFYSYGDNFDGQSLAQIGYEEGSIVGKLISEAGGEKEENKTPVDFEEGVKYKSTAAFILLNREAKWYPTPITLPYHQHELDWFDEVAPRFIGGADGRPDILLRNYPQAKENKNLRLISIRARIEPFKITVTPKENWYEKSKGKDLNYTEFRDNKDNPREDKKIGKIGLISNESYWINFHQFGFLAPVGAYATFKDGSTFGDYIARQPQGISLQKMIDGYEAGNIGVRGATYRVRVSQNYEVDRRMPKIQYNEAVTKKGGLKAETLELSLNDEDVKVEGQCFPSNTLMKEKFEDLKDLAVDNLTPESKVEFKLAGAFPEVLSIEDGLDSFSISVDDSGIFTSYVLSSKFRKPPSVETLKYKNKVDSISNNASYARSNMSNRKINTSSPGQNRPLPVS